MRISSEKTHFLGSFLSETRFFIPFYVFHDVFVQIFAILMEFILYLLFLG